MDKRQRERRELVNALRTARGALKVIATWSTFANPSVNIYKGDALDHVQTEILCEKALAESRVEGVT